MKEKIDEMFDKWINDTADMAKLVSEQEFETKEYFSQRMAIFNIEYLSRSVVIMGMKKDQFIEAIIPVVIDSFDQAEKHFNETIVLFDIVKEMTKEKK